MKFLGRAVEESFAAMHGKAWREDEGRMKFMFAVLWTRRWNSQRWIRRALPHKVGKYVMANGNFIEPSKRKIIVQSARQISFAAQSASITDFNNRKKVHCLANIAAAHEEVLRQTYLGSRLCGWFHAAQESQFGKCNRQHLAARHRVFPASSRSLI